jgi:CDGSH-type Zn-finger protein
MTRANVSARVVISKDGPYLVTGSPPLSRQTIMTDSDGGSERWQEGETFAVAKNYALCRCGHSKNKPFCDGTHAEIGFDGTETANREPYSEQANVIDGPMMLLSDAESLCAFGRFCDTHGGVWNLVARTDEPTTRATVLRQAENCPAGRLVAWDKATGKPVEQHLPVSIGLVEDRSNNVAARSGFVAVLPSFPPMASSMKCVTAQRCAVAVSHGTSPSATAHMRR